MKGTLVGGQEGVTMDMDNIELMAAGAALVGLIVALVLYKKNDSLEIEDERVAEITSEIQA